MIIDDFSFLRNAYCHLKHGNVHGFIDNNWGHKAARAVFFSSRQGAKGEVEAIIVNPREKGNVFEIMDSAEEWHLFSDDLSLGFQPLRKMREMLRGTSIRFERRKYPRYSQFESVHILPTNRVIEEEGKTSVEYLCQSKNHERGLFGFERSKSGTTFRTKLGEVHFTPEQTEFLKNLLNNKNINKEDIDMDYILRIFYPNKNSEERQVLINELKRYLDGEINHMELQYNLNKLGGLGADEVLRHLPNYFPNELKSEGYVYRTIGRKEYELLMKGEAIEAGRGGNSSNISAFDVSDRTRFSIGDDFARVKFKYKVDDKNVRYHKGYAYHLYLPEHKYSLDDVLSVDRILPIGYLHMYG